MNQKEFNKQMALLEKQVYLFLAGEVQAVNLSLVTEVDFLRNIRNNVDHFATGVDKDILAQFKENIDWVFKANHNGIRLNLKRLYSLVERYLNNITTGDVKRQKAAREKKEYEEWLKGEAENKRKEEEKKKTEKHYKIVRFDEVLVGEEFILFPGEAVYIKINAYQGQCKNNLCFRAPVNEVFVEVKKPEKQSKEKPNVDLKSTHVSYFTNRDRLGMQEEYSYLELNIPLDRGELKSQINLKDYIVDIELTKKSK